MSLTDVILPVVSLAAVVVFVAILRRYIYDFTYRTLRDVIPFLRRVALDDLQNLLHPEVEEYLKTTLSPRQFRSMQWKRVRLALQYVKDFGENAKVCQGWGKYERSLSIKFPDEARKQASMQLMTACVQARMCAFRIRITLHLWLIRMAFLPFLTPPSFKTLQSSGSFDVFVFYEQIKRAAGELSLAYGDKFYEELRQVI